MASYGVVNRLELDKALAVVLDKGVNEVQRETLKQGKNVYKGFQRLSWYTSCFTNNYKDVCANLKHDDLRFAKAVVQVVKRYDVIFDIVELYVKKLIGHITSGEEEDIEREIFHAGGKSASIFVSNRGLAYSVSMAICSSLSMTIALDSTFTKYSTVTVALAGAYGHVQDATAAARRLKDRYPIFYQALYHEDLEMLYFLVEDILGRYDQFELSQADFKRKAEIIYRLING
ncbi:hypothetical protein [Winslowiella iniecta]|uniref:hypothetical protein n=1 Tax=Winslowiella iniecta TaxID=1560201 RepID=UPI00069D3CB6|nr:hypothetical protein [Winslowiella iniecta]